MISSQQSMQWKQRRTDTIMKIIFALLVLTTVSIVSSSVAAGEADVTDVEIVKESNGSYRFNVTVSHQDTGWDHYADKWDVVAPDGTILGTRTLLHPHVEEQPFTRSLSGVKIPDDISEVTIRAHDSVHGYGGKEISTSP